MKKLIVLKDRYVIEEQTQTGFRREIRPKTWAPDFAGFNVVVDNQATGFEEDTIAKLPKEQADKRQDRIARINEANREREKARVEGDKYVSPREQKLMDKLSEAAAALSEPVKKVTKNKKEV